MRKLLAKLDMPLLILTTVLAIFGLLMIFSASSVSTILRYDVSSSFFFTRQLAFLGISYLIGFVLIIRYPTKKYSKYTIFLATLSILSLLGLFVYGEVTNQAQSWYNLGFFSLQPAEFSKTIIIIFSAVYYNILSKKNVKNIYLYAIPLVVGTFMAALVMMQPDFGSAFILGGITFFIFISVPTVHSNRLKVMKFLGAGVVILIIAIVYFGAEILNSNQLQRLEFREPCTRYTEETGYQVCNGFIAMKNGGLFGLGLGNSTQKYLYLPESHTDFIFPIIVEELGFITGTLVILVYLAILFRMLKIAKEATNLRCSILAYGTFCMLSLHLLVNLLGILAIIPLTGVPLPLLSYGGSSTVNFVLMIFIVQRVAIENKEEKIKRELKAIQG